MNLPNHTSLRRTARGFTLLEIIIVMTIIAVLASSAVYLLKGNLDVAKWQGRLRWAGRRGGLRRCRAPLGPSGSPG